jgi:hypothetical protein
MTLRSAPWFIADFDSASAMAQATARFLHRRDFRGLGLSPWLEPFAIATNLLPRPLRRLIYIKSGAMEAIPPARLGEIRAEEVSQWATGLYPQRTYPAIAIGSSNGALVHLCAALGIPWLPQTVLIPVRQSAFGPDEPVKAMRFGAEHAPRLLDANPDLQLHHMHDPNQDRLMAQNLAYFRVKRLRLGLRAVHRRPAWPGRHHHSRRLPAPLADHARRRSPLLPVRRLRRCQRSGVP